MRCVVGFVFLMILLGFTVDVGEPEVCLSSEEQKLYDLMMAYRKSRGLAPIPLSAKLTRVAQVHVHDLAEHYEFAPDKRCNPHSWSDHGKWTACCYTSDHKQADCMWAKPREIADYASSGYEMVYYSSKGATAEEGLAGWKASPGHNPMMINEGIWSKVQWKAIGVGFYGEYGAVWFGDAEDITELKRCP